MEVYQFEPAEIYSAYKLADYTPEEVGTFSITADDGNVINCNNTEFPKLKSDIELQLPVDLNIGLPNYDTELGKCVPDKLPFLHWIRETNFNLETVNVVVPRGILKKIGYTLYNYFDNPWSFKFCKYQGKLYGYQKEWDEPTDEQQMKYTLMGMKWESSATTSVDNISGCYSMVRASVGRYKVLLSAEIDAVRQSGASTTAREYIEIKSCAERSVHNKLPFGWLQCYLAGIEALHYGFRDWDGIVRSTREYRVCDIAVGRSGDGSAMFELINGVIDWAYNKLDEGTSGTLSYAGGKSHVVLTKDGRHFLPEWYVRHVGNGHVDNDHVGT